VAVSVLTWKADGDRPRYEQTRVTVELGELHARGTAIVGQSAGGDAPYRLDYELDTLEGFVTQRLVVRAEGRDWRRELWLRRESDGTWTARRITDPIEGGTVLDPDAVAGALDCDLGECPLTNTMPVLRHGLHLRAGRRELLMAWVQVPELLVLPSVQVYEHVRATHEGGVVRFRSDDFHAEIAVDRDGFVLDYPGIGSRV
jgi:uncharacterized protein